LAEKSKRPAGNTAQAQRAPFSTTGGPQSSVRGSNSDNLTKLAEIQNERFSALREKEGWIPHNDLGSFLLECERVGTANPIFNDACEEAEDINGLSQIFHEDQAPQSLEERKEEQFERLKGEYWWLDNFSGLEHFDTHCEEAKTIPEACALSDSIAGMNDVFSVERIRKTLQDQILQIKPTGSGEKRVGELILKLSKGEQLTDEEFTDLATLRDISEKQLRADKLKFDELRKRQEEVSQSPGGEAIPELDTDKFKDFAGSASQLRYGKYVGEVLGIDATLAAALNPTGGLVGPGNDGFEAIPEELVGLHGEMHDAAGYLKTYQDIGPGYSYIDPFEKIGDMMNFTPMNGQSSGVDMWVEQAQQMGIQDEFHTPAGTSVMGASTSTKASGAAQVGESMAADKLATLQNSPLNFPGR
jgi:hypothetical protein